MKVAVALSGGVDSAVAAWILREQGHEVTGVTMLLNPGGETEDAREAAGKLGIPHRIVDFSGVFSRTVIADFCQEYSRGRTPNPCVKCNQYIKFGVLMDTAMKDGADFIATGHHARIETDQRTGMYFLKKGADLHKDQSYFLYRLTQRQLGCALFPVGNIGKDEVKQIARRLGLPAAEKRESQEICFIPNNDYPRFIEKYIPGENEPGPILDTAGNVLGSHRGTAAYTVGQRRGLGLAADAPLYVTAIDWERNAVVVGAKEETFGSELAAAGVSWISGAVPGQAFRAGAKIRYRQPEAAVTVIITGNSTVLVKFDEPQPAITPGQSIVFYEGDTVLGGGIIEETGKWTCRR